MNKYYIKSALVTLFLSVSIALNAQTGNVSINNTGTPSVASAILDLSSNPNLGFLMTNVNLASSTDATTIPTPTTGMIVWNTNAGMPYGVGFYYWSGSAWLYVSNSGAGSSLTGSGTAGYSALWTGPTALGIGAAQDNGLGLAISSTALTAANMLDVKGNAAFGTYAGTAAPANGLIVSGQVGIGITVPDASAALDITSTTQGLLPPRMTAVQMGNIVGPATGLTVLNITTNCLEYYNGTGWQPLVCPCTSAPNIGNITGTAAACASTSGNIYSVTSVANATYFWTVPAGATITAGQGTNSITVTFGTTAGNIGVTAVNSCGTSTATLAITLSTPLTNPAIPSGPTSPLVSAASTYTIATVPGASSYTWTVSSTNATITSGQNTTSLTINCNATPTTFTICVYATNGCGNSATECLTVTSTSCAPSILLDAVSGTAPVSTNTITITTTAANEIIAINAEGDPFASAITCTASVTGPSSGAATLIGSANGNYGGSAVFAFAAPTAGAYTITITPGTYSATYFMNFAASFKGWCSTPTVAGNVTLGGTTSYTGGTGLPSESTSVTTTIAHSAIFTGYGDANGGGSAETWTGATILGTPGYLFISGGEDGSNSYTLCPAATIYTPTVAITGGSYIDYAGLVSIIIHP